MFWRKQLMLIRNDSSELKFKGWLWTISFDRSSNEEERMIKCYYWQWMSLYDINVFLSHGFCSGYCWCFHSKVSRLIRSIASQLIAIRRSFFARVRTLLINSPKRDYLRNKNSRPSFIEMYMMFCLWANWSQFLSVMSHWSIYE